MTLVCRPDDHLAANAPGPLDQQLRREDPSALARDARRLGDARRGALVFYQPALTCTRCHVNERADAPPTLGPDLAALGKEVPDVELVEGILEPSKAIKKGYEPITIATDDGRTITGLLAEDRPDAVVLRDPGQDGKSITIARGRIEQQSRGGPSIMPAGLVNMLGFSAAVPRPVAIPHGDRRAWAGAGPRLAARPGAGLAPLARLRTPDSITPG